MNKSMLKILERAFVAEIDGAINKSCDLIQPKNKKLADELWLDGYLEKGTYCLAGGVSITISGYRLTHLGRLTYCSTC